MDRAIGIYGGAWVALILDEDHDLWGLGAGGEPFCLLMDTPWDDPPQLVKLLENVVTAGSGDEQAMALLEDGTIMRWSSQGVQQFLTGCTALWVESTDGYALTEEGQLLGWGRQLPIEGMRETLYQEPQVILDDAKDLVAISSYQGIRCFLHSDGPCGGQAGTRTATSCRWSRGGRKSSPAWNTSTSPPTTGFGCGISAVSPLS